MNMYCILLCSSFQKSPTQSLFANVLWQAKFFLLKKEGFKNRFCLVYTCVAQTHLSGSISTKWLRWNALKGVRSYASKCQKEAVSFCPRIISVFQMGDGSERGEA